MTGPKPSDVDLAGGLTREYDTLHRLADVTRGIYGRQRI